MYLMGYERDGTYTIKSTTTYARFDGDAYEVSRYLLEWLDCSDWGGPLRNTFVDQILGRLHGTFILETKDVVGFCKAIRRHNLAIASALADSIVEKSELWVERERLTRRLEPAIKREYEEYGDMLKHLRE